MARASMLLRLGLAGDPPLRFTPDPLEQRALLRRLDIPEFSWHNVVRELDELDWLRFL